MFSDDKVGWLAKQWFDQNDNKAPSRSQILKGIINADKTRMIQLFPKYPQGHASMDKVLAARKLAWQLLSIVSGFSSGDANEPIDEEILSTGFNDPLVCTILYIFAMESPIKYLLQSDSQMHKEAYIKDLGPFAYALQTIVRNISKSRPEADPRVKFWSYMGSSMLDAQIADIKELEATKKDKALSMNLVGFNTCYDRKMA